MDNQTKDHRYLDEAGDLSFLSKGKRELILGKDGVSNCFILGMLKINEDPKVLREKIEALEQSIEESVLYNQIPSVVKRIKKNKYFFHCKDDHPEIRAKFFEFVSSVDCSFQAVVGRKEFFYNKNKNNLVANDLYTEILSHLIKDKFKIDKKLILNIASRGSSTNYKNLQLSLKSAEERFLKTNTKDAIKTNVVFNVQDFINEPILSVVDYYCWAIQRVYERGETRFYDYLFGNISLVFDLWDIKNYKGYKNYYRGKNRLTEENKIK